MATIYPDCTNKSCYAAFVATSGLGLYKTESLIFDDNSDPTWEHVGQILPISQIAYTTYSSNPRAAQICISDGTGWLRRERVGDSWVEVLTKEKIYNAVLAAGFPASMDFTTKIGWVDLWSENILYAVALHGASIDAGGGSGQFFLKSINGGNSWYVPPTGRLFAHGTRNFQPGLLSIQHGATASQPTGSVLFATARSQFGDSVGIVYSKDYGESWNPWVSSKNACSPYMWGMVNGAVRPMPSMRYINSVYTGLHAGLGKFKVWRKDGWGAGPTVDKQVNYPSEYIGWIARDGVWHRKSQLFYVGGKEHTLRWTQNMEGDVETVWNTVPMGSHVSAICEYDLPQHLLVGFDNAVPDSSDGQYHLVRSTDNMYEWYFKAGSIPNRKYSIYGEIQTGSIHQDAGRVSINGIALWDAQDPIIPTPPPNPSGYGWPIWINAGARELRPDPSWDRLYVVAETVWPAGEGLWNQPLLFQFILSGDYAGTYYENKGYLAFLPTIMLGQDTIYSGGIQYNGHLEMHVDSPTFHQATVVGLFDTNKQVYHNEDLTSSTYGYISGWPTEGWNLAGEFGSDRVTSVAHASTLIKDMTITYTQVDKPNAISGYPWGWQTAVEDVPFSVNTQLREGNNLFVGVEDDDTAQPIRHINITYSGEGWQNRGGGLPELQINDISRGDY